LSRNKKKKVFAGFVAFFVPKKSVLQKKKVSAGFGALFVPKTSVLQKKVSAGFGAFFVPKASVLQKKGLRRIWSVFLSQKWLRIQVLGKSRISRGAAAPLIPAPMVCF